MGRIEADYRRADNRLWADLNKAAVTVAPAIRKYLAQIGKVGGKKGGKVSSKAKTAAARRNARQPRPRKEAK